MVRQQQDAGQKYHAKGKKAQKLHAIYMTFIPLYDIFEKTKTVRIESYYQLPGAKIGKGLIKKQWEGSFWRKRIDLYFHYVRGYVATSILQISLNCTFGKR